MVGGPRRRRFFLGKALSNHTNLRKIWPKRQCRKAAKTAFFPPPFSPFFFSPPAFFFDPTHAQDGMIPFNDLVDFTTPPVRAVGAVLGDGTIDPDCGRGGRGALGWDEAVLLGGRDHEHPPLLPLLGLAGPRRNLLRLAVRARVQL